MTDATVHNLNGNVPTSAEAKRGCLGLEVRVTMSGVDYIFEGVLEHFIAGEASILLDHSFLKETKVRVEFNGFRFDGEVLFCERKGELYDTHIVIPNVDETGVRAIRDMSLTYPGNCIRRTAEAR